jgi:hypothetical protein
MVIGCCKMGGLQKVLTIGALENKNNSIIIY